MKRKIVIEMSVEAADYIAEEVERIQGYVGVVATSGLQPWEACDEFLIAYKKAKELL
tara:strand:- start:194 stop:364 length:171 start_codon:yes stop_codon:yes gene_type:complete